MEKSFSHRKRRDVGVDRSPVDHEEGGVILKQASLVLENVVGQPAQGLRCRQAIGAEKKKYNEIR